MCLFLSPPPPPPPPSVINNFVMDLIIFVHICLLTPLLLLGVRGKAVYVVRGLEEGDVCS